jgi:hypothetical protein
MPITIPKGQKKDTIHMGLAASQARLLSLTARIHDVEFEAQQLQYAKLKLAMVEDDVLKKYEEALDAETLTMPSADGQSRIKATFENLCGLGSINSNLGRGQYIFRDRMDRIMVPSDIHEGFLNYGGSDPYEFALYMMGADVNDSQNVDKFKDTINNITLNESNNGLKELKDNIYKQIETLFKESNVYEDNDGAFQDFARNFFQSLISDNDADLNEKFSNIDNKVNGKSIKDIIESLKNSAKEYEAKLYKQYNGGKAVYTAIKGNDSGFSEKEFNYYVRWGQIIMREGGIVGEEDNRYLSGCVDASAGEDDIETNADLLNQYLMFGYASIDVVYDDGKGWISDLPTSNATDTKVYMDKESKVDSIAVKKAEAEKERKLKEINRIDKNYDLSLNRLETERTALTTEYDSVKKVISDNVERTFGIFS